MDASYVDPLLAFASPVEGFYRVVFIGGDTSKRKEFQYDRRNHRVLLEVGGLAELIGVTPAIH